MLATTRFILAGAFAASCVLSACDKNEPSEEDGVISLAVTAAPSGVGCLRITTAAAARSTVRTVAVNPGMAITTSLSGLPTGAVTVTAEAFAEACSAVTAMSVATWSSDPFPVTLAAGVAQPVQLVMRQNGRITLSIDWDTTGDVDGGGTPDGGGMMGGGGSGGGTPDGGGMMGGGGSSGCPGCARLSTPLTASQQIGDAFIDLSMSPLSAAGATLTARVCKVSGTGGGFQVFAFSGATLTGQAGAFIPFAMLTDCAIGFSNVDLSLTAPGDNGMFDPTNIVVIGVLVAATDPGPWANPSIVQIDSLRLSTGAIGPFNFDASALPLTLDAGAIPGTTLTWVGP